MNDCFNTLSRAIASLTSLSQTLCIRRQKTYRSKQLTEHKSIEAVVVGSSHLLDSFQDISDYEIDDVLPEHIPVCVCRFEQLECTVYGVVRVVSFTFFGPEAPHTFGFWHSHKLFLADFNIVVVVAHLPQWSLIRVLNSDRINLNTQDYHRVPLAFGRLYPHSSYSRCSRSALYGSHRDGNQHNEHTARQELSTAYQLCPEKPNTADVPFWRCELHFRRSRPQ